MEITGHRGKQAGHDLSKLPPARNSLVWFNGLCEKEMRLDDGDEDQEWINENPQTIFYNIQNGIYDLRQTLTLWYANDVDIPKQFIIQECTTIYIKAMTLADIIERRSEGKIRNIIKPILKFCAQIANAAMMVADYVERRLDK